MKVNKLTPKEREMLRRAAEFALAGEWPWEDTKELRERPILQRAADKLARRSDGATTSK